MSQPKTSANPGRRRPKAGKAGPRTARPCATPTAAPADDLQRDLQNILADPDLWLNTPNDLFGGRLPVELIGTEDENLLREWVGAVQHGVMS